MTRLMASSAVSRNSLGQYSSSFPRLRVISLVFTFNWHILTFVAKM